MVLTIFPNKEHNIGFTFDTVRTLSWFLTGERPKGVSLYTQEALLGGPVPTHVDIMASHIAIACGDHTLNYYSTSWRHE